MRENGGLAKGAAPMPSYRSLDGTTHQLEDKGMAFCALPIGCFFTSLTGFWPSVFYKTTATTYQNIGLGHSKTSTIYNISRPIQTTCWVPLPFSTPE